MEKREQIIAKAWKDPEFKKRLLTQPKETLIEMGWKISDKVTVKAIEDKSDTYTFVLPATPSKLANLPDSDLLRMAGGAGESNFNLHAMG